MLALAAWCRINANTLYIDWNHHLCFWAFHKLSYTTHIMYILSFNHSACVEWYHSVVVFSSNTTYMIMSLANESSMLIAIITGLEQFVNTIIVTACKINTKRMWYLHLWVSKCICECQNAEYISFIALIVFFFWFHLVIQIKTAKLWSSLHISIC